MKSFLQHGLRLRNSYAVALEKFSRNRDFPILRRLKEVGVRLSDEEVVKAKEQPLAGQEFVITGKLEKFSRQEAETKIKTLGGITKDNVTQKTKYLVVGADPGSKLVRAQALDTKLLTEEEFLRLLEGKS